jgi:uncharacterized RDD family membrane protein YckC
MVLRDLSTPESYPPELSKVAYKLPFGPVTDRFLAFILDFLILSPVVSFFLATTLRDLKTLQITNSESEEAVVIWLAFMVGIVVISCGLQACFLYFWQATPGQKFLQLRVISFPPRNDSDTLSPGQALTRTIGWWASTLMLGIPFLEIVGHPFRRGFHERLSDTLVVSLKQEHSDMPLPAETRYVGTTLWLFFGVLFLIGAMFMAKAYKEALLEGYSTNKAVAAVNFCPALLTDDYKDKKRLDMAIALYISEQVDEDCVRKEAQKVLWGASNEDKPLADLAMAMISDNKDEIASYHQKACEAGEKSEACAISNYLQSEEPNREEALRRTGLALVSSRVLLLNDAMESTNYVAAAGLLQDLKLEAPLREFLDRHLVKAAWEISKSPPRKGSSRQPASVEDAALLKQFKIRFGIQ